MTADTLIEPTTGEATGVIKATHGMLPMTVFATGLAGAEVVDVQVSPDEGSTPADLYQDGAKVSLTATNTAISIVSPGYYTFDKDSTSGASGVYVSRKDHI